MKLYEGPTSTFVDDTTQNRIAERLKNSYLQYYGYNPGTSEIASWTNSLQFVKNLIIIHELKDNAICLEYELPYTNERIDCMLFGKDSSDEENVVVIELKQWSSVEDCDIDGNVVTFVGGAKRMVPHPSYQVEGYHFLLRDFLDVFENKPTVNLSSCVYCHNYPKGDTTLFLPKFQGILQKFPLYAKDDFQNLGQYLKQRLGKGDGLQILNRFAQSNIRPSKKLLEHVSSMVKGQKMFNLIDEQIVANNTILDRAKKSSKLKRKSVIIVRGGPGTGKSVIALNVLAELLSQGKKVFHATGSKSFTETLRAIVGKQASALFRYFNTFNHNVIEENSIDVLICDEAHRMRKSSNGRFTPKHQRSALFQVEELVRAAKVSIFFIDDYQVVRPDEVGNVESIKQAAKRYDAEIFDFELKTQFRCNGSEGYLNWIDNTLGIRQTANLFLSKEEKMEFRIFDHIKDMYDAIGEKNKQKPNSARMVAGFCWPWSYPNKDGTLVHDIIIDRFTMPWEGRQDVKLAPGIPQWFQWAFDPSGVDQCGCVYTIQGFEFDYVGLIFGKDLIYDPVKNTWIGKPENSHDPVVKKAKENFADYIKNVYRVLLTRGMKGCYVYFLDEETKKYFRSRIEDGRIFN